MSKKITLIGGGVLGVQIGLMCAYTGHDTTFWLRSEGSIGRTQPKIDLYSEWMLSDLEAAIQRKPLMVLSHRQKRILQNSSISSWIWQRR